MRALLAAAAAAEAATGAALLVSPAVVVRLLFGAEIAASGIVMSRIFGISLLALGIACWPGESARTRGPAHRGMPSYSALATFVLAYVGLGGESTGVLLWPAALAHGIITVLLALALFRD